MTEKITIVPDGEHPVEIDSERYQNIVDKINQLSGVSSRDVVENTAEELGVNKTIVSTILNREIARGEKSKIHIPGRGTRGLKDSHS